MNRRRPPIRRSAAFRTVFVAALLAAPGVARSQPPGPDPEVLRVPGLEYEQRVLTTPRTNRVYILQVDLAAGRVRPAVVVAPDPDGTGPAEAALTDPRQLAADPDVLAFVNANPWDGLPDATGKPDRSWRAGQPVEITGLAATGGHLRSAATSGGASVRFMPAGRVRLGDVPADAAVSEGLAGFQPVVRAGVVSVAPDGPRHPRTALGTDAEGRHLWLVVVDGRQPGFSEGLDLAELGGLMAGLGCHEAVNLDGGGSSVMGLSGADGTLQIVNRPSDRNLLGQVKVRPLPLVLTLRRAGPATSSPPAEPAPSAASLPGTTP